MRPPHYTGENERGAAWRMRPGDASMRPPHYTGENMPVGIPHDRADPASMRPPHYTGENGAEFYPPPEPQGLQ